MTILINLYCFHFRCLRVVIHRVEILVKEKKNKEIQSHALFDLN